MPIAILSPLVVTGCALIIILLERLFPYDRGQPFLRDGLFGDLVLYSIVQSYVLAYVIFGIAHGLDHLTGLSSHGIISGWPIPMQLLLSLVTHDLYIYWFHRLQHRIPALWRIHEAHHSTKDVDWLSGSRSHALEILINQSIEFTPLILLGAHPDVLLYKGMVDAVWGMYIHSNIDVRSGRLQRVINGPEMHRWHHAVDEDAHNRNFSTKFAIWDWMFGTAYLPTGRKPRGYGLGEEPFPHGYLRQLAFAFRRNDAPAAHPGLEAPPSPEAPSAAVDAYNNLP
ncbi:MAG: sterol desaturase family protein [Bacteroidetes bacterium]|nr:sterol desaturase family protein [Bacteroidota bacterium]